MLDLARPALAGLFAAFRRDCGDSHAPRVPAGGALSVREREVLRWLCAGKTDRDIGRSSVAAIAPCKSTCSASTRSSASKRAPRPSCAGSTARTERAPAARAVAMENPRMTAELTLVRPDDWHLHVRDGAALRAVVPHSARQFGRAIIMPNLRPPIVERRAGAGLSRAGPRGGAGRRRLHAADDALPHRRDAAGRDAARARGRRRRHQALSGRRDHQQRRRRHRAEEGRRHAGRGRARGHRPAGARRGHRSRRRRVRPRGGLHRAPLAGAAARLSGAEDRARAHHDQGRRAVRRRGRAADGGDRSPRTTCSTTATRSSAAACARTTTACRC